MTNSATMIRIAYCTTRSRPTPKIRRYFGAGSVCDRSDGAFWGASVRVVMRSVPLSDVADGPGRIRGRPPWSLAEHAVPLVGERLHIRVGGDRVGHPDDRVLTGLADDLPVGVETLGLLHAVTVGGQAPFGDGVLALFGQDEVEEQLRGGGVRSLRRDADAATEHD